MIAQPVNHIAVVSDVSLGYGSPQVLALARSLGHYFRSPVQVFEPDQSGRAPCEPEGAPLPIHRVATASAPYSRAGRIEYVLKTAEALNHYRPEIVVVFNSFCLPVLAKLKHRPRCSIYALSEMVRPYGRFAVEVNRFLASQVDLLIFPEENRARIDVQRCGFSRIPLALMYNVHDAPAAAPVAPNERNGRLFYGGAIGSDAGMADYFLRSEMDHTPLDLYGDVTGPDRDALRQRLTQAVHGPQYLGCIDARKLAARRRRYTYSIVMYRPALEHTRYAAPNKFFDAITDGVPPIVAPHPQCKMIVERYRCGIVMRDWSFEAYRDAVGRAMSLVGTKRYARMVENCQRAVREELNWATQFEKLRRLLPAAA